MVLLKIEWCGLGKTGLLLVQLGIRGCVGGDGDFELLADMVSLAAV